MLVAVIWLGSSFYIVDASQRGVVLQFGRFKETTEPGLRWRFPWPIQSNEIVNLSGVRTVEVGYRGSDKNKVPKEALMLTDDENIVSVLFAVQYLLKDPKAYLFNNRHAGSGNRDSRSSGQEQDGLRALRGTRPDRREYAKADSGHTRSLRYGHPGALGEHAGYSAAGTGAGSVR